MSVTKITHQYISQHPSVKDCLKKGLINFSALARDICEAYDIKKFDAALIACRRYFGKLKSYQPNEKKILTLLQKAKINIKNKITVAIVEKPKDFERVTMLQKSVRKTKGDFNLIEGDEALVIVSSSEHLGEIKDAFKGKIIKLSTGLVQVSLKFDASIEVTPGVVSYVYGLLADNNINVLEEMSCWTELMFLIDEEDSSRALRALTIEN